MMGSLLPAALQAILKWSEPVEGISDIKIVGIDEKRRPKILKEPYINLYFKLSHKAPPDWCLQFNRLFSHYKYSTKINEKEGLYVETWVRTPDEIAPLLLLLKTKVSQCIDEYIEKINAATRGSVEQLEETGAQGDLNRIIEGLNFD
jgi:hypothetical protein